MTYMYTFCSQIILPLIFKLLSLADRKRVRLTCKAWKNACDNSFITDQEKLVLRTHDHPVISIFTQLVRTRAVSSSHFEFHGLVICNLGWRWWQLCGDQMTSLVLYECRMNDELLENIILFCTKMRALSIDSHAVCTFSYDFLNRFIAHGIERPNLLSLKLHMIDVPDVLVQKLFQIYPNIQTLNQESVPGSFPPQLKNFTQFIRSDCLWLMPLSWNPAIK